LHQTQLPLLSLWQHLMPSIEFDSVCCTTSEILSKCKCPSEVVNIQRSTLGSLSYSSLVLLQSLYFNVHSSKYHLQYWITKDHSKYPFRRRWKSIELKRQVFSTASYWWDIGRRTFQKCTVRPTLTAEYGASDRFCWHFFVCSQRYLNLVRMVFWEITISTHKTLWPNLFSSRKAK
jgi:hypothetical protein